MSSHFVCLPDHHATGQQANNLYSRVEMISVAAFSKKKLTTLAWGSKARIANPVSQLLSYLPPTTKKSNKNY
jgi:hypothetical protein